MGICSSSVDVDSVEPFDYPHAQQPTTNGNEKSTPADIGMQSISAAEKNDSFPQFNTRVTNGAGNAANQNSNYSIRVDGLNHPANNTNAPPTMNSPIGSPSVSTSPTNSGLSASSSFDNSIPIRNQPFLRRTRPPSVSLFQFDPRSVSMPGGSNQTSRRNSIFDSTPQSDGTIISPPGAIESLQPLNFHPSPAAIRRRKTSIGENSGFMESKLLIPNPHQLHHSHSSNQLLLNHQHQSSIRRASHSRNHSHSQGQFPAHLLANNLGSIIHTNNNIPNQNSVAHPTAVTSPIDHHTNTTNNQFHRKSISQTIAPAIIPIMPISTSTLPSPSQQYATLIPAPISPQPQQQQQQAKPKPVIQHSLLEYSIKANLPNNGISLPPPIHCSRSVFSFVRELNNNSFNNNNNNMNNSLTINPYAYESGRSTPKSDILLLTPIQMNRYHTLNNNNDKILFTPNSLVTTNNINSPSSSDININHHPDYMNNNIEYSHSSMIRNSSFQKQPIYNNNNNNNGNNNNNNTATHNNNEPIRSVQAF